MDDRFLQQLKKGVLELLVLEVICRTPTYGYQLLTTLCDRSDGLFSLKEGTLYPILYRLEDDGLIASSWLAPAGRAAPKRIYSATPEGTREAARRREIWRTFVPAVAGFYQGDSAHETY